MNYKAILLVITTFLAVYPLQAQTALLRNGGFEGQTLGQIDFWQTDSFKNTDDARRVFPVDKPVHDGKQALAIVNLVPNDTRVVQWLAVEPDSFYRITCWVMAEKVSQGTVGANISILGSITPSTDFMDTGDRWRRLELVGKTGAEQTALAVTLRLGFYENLVTGRAYFDDARVEKMVAPPAGARIVDFSSNRGIGLIRPAPEEKRTAVWTGPAHLNVYLAVGAGIMIILSAVISLLVAAGRKRREKAHAARAAAEPKPATTSVDVIARAQRKSLRVNVTVKKPLSGDNYRLIELKSVNISTTGMLLASDDMSVFTVGERVELTAQYKRQPFDLGAVRVVRKQETHHGKDPAIRGGFGLVFIDTNTAQQKNIKILLA